jgi:hypothetical protein
MMSLQGTGLKAELWSAKPGEEVHTWTLLLCDSDIEKSQQLSPNRVEGQRLWGSYLPFAFAFVIQMYVSALASCLGTA